MPPTSRRFWKEALMSKKIEFSMELSLCEGCSRVHLDLFLPGGGVYSLPLDDDQWDAMFIKYAQMKRVRDTGTTEGIEVLN